MLLVDALKNIELQLKDVRRSEENIDVHHSEKDIESLLEGIYHLEEDLEFLRKKNCQLFRKWSNLNKKIYVKDHDIREEFEDLKHFYLFREHIIINGGLHCING
ncbi:28191_t:CDS:1, partial [Racocetra persica]